MTAARLSRRSALCAALAVVTVPATAKEMETMRVSIGVKPHARQRYDTVGDWRLKPDHGIAVSVSAIGDWRYELLVGLHEMIEAAICAHRGISEASVTKFDEAFEDRRAEGSTAEPGDDPAAPYHREHVFATSVERMLAVELGVDWAEYEAAINKL